LKATTVLINCTAPIFQPLLAPARYKDSAQRLAMYLRTVATSRRAGAQRRLLGGCSDRKHEEVTPTKEEPRMGSGALHILP